MNSATDEGRLYLPLAPQGLKVLDPKTQLPKVDSISPQ